MFHARFDCNPTLEPHKMSKHSTCSTCSLRQRDHSIHRPHPFPAHCVIRLEWNLWTEKKIAYSRFGFPPVATIPDQVACNRTVVRELGRLQSAIGVEVVQLEISQPRLGDDAGRLGNRTHGLYINRSPKHHTILIPLRSTRCIDQHIFFSTMRGAVFISLHRVDGC